jgi:hypothetical protein
MTLAVSDLNDVSGVSRNLRRTIAMFGDHLLQLGKIFHKR